MTLPVMFRPDIKILTPIILIHTTTTPILIGLRITQMPLKIRIHMPALIGRTLTRIRRTSAPIVIIGGTGDIRRKNGNNCRQQIKAVTSLVFELRNVIRKSLSIAEAVSKGVRSETSQTLNGQQNVTGGNLRGGRSSLKVLSWPAQPGRSPERGHDASALMMSQLG
jgi:hypothetical protein